METGKVQIRHYDNGNENETDTISAFRNAQRMKDKLNVLIVPARNHAAGGHLKPLPRNTRGKQGGKEGMTQ